MLRLFPLLILILLICSGPARADSQQAIDQVRTQLSQLEANNPEQQPLRELYQQILTALQNTQQHEQRSAQLSKRIEQLPGETDTLRKALSRPPRPESLDELERTPLHQIEQQQTVRRANLLSLEKTHGLLAQKIQQMEQKQVKLREQLALLRQQLESDSRAGKGAVTDGGQLADLRLQLKNARFTESTAQIQADELELLALPGEIELAQLSLEQHSREIGQQQQVLDQVQAHIQLRRRVEAEAALSELGKPANQELQHPLLVQTLTQNQALSAQLRQAISESEQVVQAKRRLELQSTELTDSYRTIQQQLELNIGYIGVELRRLMLRLSKPVDTQSTRGRINELRLLNLELSRNQFSLQTDLSGQAIVPDQQLSTTQRQHYTELLKDQLSLNKRVRDARQQLISEHSLLLAVQEQVNEQIRQSRQLLNQNLLWLPSIAPINLHWLADFGNGLVFLLQHWNDALRIAPLQLNSEYTAGLLGVFLLTLVVLVLRRHESRHRRQWFNELGNVVHDRFFRTCSLLFSAPLIAAPLPLALLLSAYFGLNPQHPDAAGLSHALIFITGATWYTHSLTRWLRTPDGLLAGHFSVPEELARRLRNRLVVLYTFAVPLASVLLITEQLDSMELRSGINRASFIGLALSAAVFWSSMWPVRAQLNSLMQVRRWWLRAELWLSLFTVFNLLLVGMALWGYVFTASIFMLVALVIVCICFSVFILYHLGLRWLLIEERKLAFARVRARRAEILAAREKNEEVPPLEENLLDMQTISEQARLLLKMLTLAVLISALWLLLGDFLPTLNVLDNIQLWSTTVAGAGGDILDPISLQDLLLGLLVLGLSLLAAQNLPGLLELLVLRHLTLAPGTGFAITSLVKYVLIFVGILVSFSLFGVAWNKLQWLIAALGVGLGFGLQEIVANFVSGVIILFEKPVRIGDTVTIGGLTGNVTRIQIRATTIVDWDRKEVIIPNKTFITSELVNWSLSDAVTRVVINVGIAYGSDTALARSLLLSVAGSNPKVLKEPAPEAYFLLFGASSLDLSLRVFVSSMSDRNVVTHELNSAIDQAFKANNIEIAFPQLDVHLHRTEKASQTKEKPLFSHFDP